MSAVTVAPRGMSWAAMTVGSCVGGAVLRCPFGWLPPSSSTIPTNATTARNTPMSRTRRFERFKLGLPEPCDRWHHCSSAHEARDYTNGLGPLGRIGRKPRVRKVIRKVAYATFAARQRAPAGHERTARPESPDGPFWMSAVTGLLN